MLVGFFIDFLYTLMETFTEWLIGRLTSEHNTNPVKHVEIDNWLKEVDKLKSSLDDLHKVIRKKKPTKAKNDEKPKDKPVRPEDEKPKKPENDRDDLGDEETDDDDGEDERLEKPQFAPKCPEPSPKPELKTKPKEERK